MNDLHQVLWQVVPFAIALPVMFLVARKRGLSLREDLRLVWPNRLQVAVWIPAWILWLALNGRSECWHRSQSWS